MPSSGNNDLNICYLRERQNFDRLVSALAPYHPRPRDFPADLLAVPEFDALREASQDEDA